MKSRTSRGLSLRRSWTRESKRGVTAKTWNDTLKLLRATFNYLLSAERSIRSQACRHGRRRRFSVSVLARKLKAILDAARGDDFMRPVLVAGMCTAMRRGDCCLLKWKDVDLKRRFITVKTAETGQT